MKRFLLYLMLLALLLAGGAWLVAGRMAAPEIEIARPGEYVGLATPFEVAVGSPQNDLSSLDIVFEQDGSRTTLYSMAEPGDVQTKQDGERILLTGVLGRETVEGLKSGPARLVVTAARQVLYGMRTRAASAAHDVQVRLERPRLSVLSTHHYINHGGSELVVYRVTPEDVESGVVVGEVEYPGYPASGATVDGVRIADPAIRIAYFSLLHDQDLDTRIRLYARDPAGNTAGADFDYRTFPKPFKRSRISLDDRFLDRVVPAILDGTEDISPEGDTLQKFLAINGELRQKNAEKIASFAAETAPEMLWRGEVFHPFTSSSVESAFADQRTYIYEGEEVDRQVHLGFDLASLAGAPIVAANHGTVLFADELGIYGNAVIIDHGMGLQSLYAHLSSLEVQAGDTVRKEQPLGRSGMTGLAGGDHLHFTMLVHGRMVNPVEWWDGHWIEDRILRKLRAVSSGAGIDQ